MCFCKKKITILSYQYACGSAYSKSNIPVVWKKNEAFGNSVHKEK